GMAKALLRLLVHSDDEAARQPFGDRRTVRRTHRNTRERMEAVDGLRRMIDQRPPAEAGKHLVLPSEPPGQARRHKHNGSRMDWRNHDSARPSLRSFTISASAETASERGSREANRPIGPLRRAMSSAPAPSA